jgi:radical SAM protein with 4Fe4S-binding SPASM domain
MSLSVAQEALSRHLGAPTPHEDFQIDFFGGEPFLEFDLIKDITNWMWSNSWPKPYFFFATSNGTLIHGATQSWLSKHKDKFIVGLSLDGTHEMHNANRSNSFDKIDWNFFLKTWPKQPVKMTVSTQTLPNLSAGVKFIHELGFRIEGNLAWGVDWSDKRNIDLLSAQLDDLVSYYVANPSIEPGQLLSMDIDRIATNSTPVKKCCGVGEHIVAIDVDGQEYPCHLFEPLSLGDRAVRYSEIDFSTSESFHDSRCEGCVLLPICPTCYGINYIETGKSSSRIGAICALTKVRAVACAKLAAAKLVTSSTMPDDEGSAAKRLRTIRAIKTIQTSVVPSI